MKMTIKYEKIIEKKYIGKHKVYDIGLEGPHNFMTENGLIASNCFNKSHSVAYSYLTYITAYLKANYPMQFFCSLMTTRSKSLQPKDWAQKAPQYVNEARQLGVDINAPSVNASDLEFTISQNEIYFGLNAIRDVGKTAARSIMAARQKKPFKNVFDFVSRVNTQKVNTKTFMALVKAGAFDKMGYCRIELEENCQPIYDYYKNIEEYAQRLLDIQERKSYNEQVMPQIERRNLLRKQYKSETNKRNKNKTTMSEVEYIELQTELEELESLNLKKKVSLKEKPEPVKPTLNKYEKIKITLSQIIEQANYIGCYLQTHPAQFINTKDKIQNMYINQYGRIAAVVTSFKEITTKRNQKMAFLELDDSNIICEGVIFPKSYNQIKNLNLKQGELIMADVKVQSTDPYKLIVNKINIYQG